MKPYGRIGSDRNWVNGRDAWKRQQAKYFQTLAGKVFEWACLRGESRKTEDLKEIGSRSS